MPASEATNNDMTDKSYAYRPIVARNQLSEHFTRANRSPADALVGIEFERVVVADDGQAVPYEGEHGVVGLLDRLKRNEVKSAVFLEEVPGGPPLGVRFADADVTLEPGAQIEHVGAPCQTAKQAAEGIKSHFRRLNKASEGMNFHFIAGGFQPFSKRRQMTWLPKGRYAHMRQYLPKRGGLGLDMMLRTATIQASYDYAGLDDGFSKLRMAMGVSSIVTAIFAASPMVEGRLTGQVSHRAAVWLDTDPDRCGLVQGVFESGASLEAYVDWAIRARMFFVKDSSGHLVSAKGRRFQDLLEHGFEGRGATLGDWELHLSTLFPEVRLGRQIEVRGADSPTMPYAYAMGAMWRGLFYDATARSAAYDLVKGWTPEQRERVRREVPTKGLKTVSPDGVLCDLARVLVDISRDGLSSCQAANQTDFY